jgi:predicted nucleic acid binding AN1-type Zn finger protein
MTQVTHLNARLIKVERERDALVLVNFKLRDKLLELAKQCNECDGTGCVTKRWLDQHFQPQERVEDCPKCHDIRSVLA